MRTWIIGLVLLAACESGTIAPAAPLAQVRATAVQRASNRPATEASIVDAPIAFARAPAIRALELSVPRKFGDTAQRIVVPTNTRQSFAFAATRTPFTVAFNGSRVTLTTVISYLGFGWYQPMIGPFVRASCGTDEATPRLRLVLVSDVTLMPQWHVRAHTRVESIEPVSAEKRDQCRVTMFNIDVTNRVIDALRPQLEHILPELDQRIVEFDVRTSIEGWYNQLNESIRIRDSLWFLIGPEQVQLGGLRMDDTALVAVIRLFAHPRMVTGPRPPRLPLRLPSIFPVESRASVATPKAHMVLEGYLDYHDASAVVSSALVGRGISRYGRAVRVTSARLYPLGDGRIALGVGIEGAITGEAFFVGTPKLDTVSRMLTVPDLDFDVATANTLVRGLAWLKKADLVAELRKRARIPLDTMLNETRSKVDGAINRKLTDGVLLSGHLGASRLLDVTVDPQFLVVRAEGEGALGLSINKEIPLGKSKQGNPRRETSEPTSAKTEVSKVEKSKREKLRGDTAATKGGKR